MKIRFLKTFATDRVVFRNGMEHDLDDAQASEYINRELAEEVKPADMPPTPARVGRPSSQNKRN